MCTDCGCGEATARQEQAHGHDHPHDHPHPHGHDHSHEHGHDHGHEHPPQTRKITVERNILAHNDEVAARNRAWLNERGVVSLNLMSSPGSGKTLLLEKTLERLRGRIQCAVIAGDQQTDNDAQRLAGKGAPVQQIETRNSCHLDAERVEQVLPQVIATGTKLLFIENVGNLVCPAAFALGETCRVALLSTTEGEDKPEKYPTLFSSASTVVLTKMDLAPYLEWDLNACRRSIQRVHPGIFTFELSAKTGSGMDEWCSYLERLVL